MKHLKRVGVLRGGPSNEYEVSLNSGAAVLSALRERHSDRYHPIDIFIDRAGNWHIDGVAHAPTDAIRKMDVAFNALHGNYGEDGKLQAFFEHHNIPFTGSGSLGSALGMNKALAKKVFADHCIPSPYGGEISSDHIRNHASEIVRELFHSFHLPAVVKPSSSGSSVGVSLVKMYTELPQALNEAANHSESVIIEEFIPGVEATCGVIEDFRGEEIYTLPPIEIRPHNKFFDYEAKYLGKSLEIVPATFSSKIKHAIMDMAKKVHKALGLRHYSRTDFIVHPKRGIYVLEVNTLPGLTKESLFPKSLRAVGSDLPEFIEHLIERAV